MSSYTPHESWYETDAKDNVSTYVVVTFDYSDYSEKHTYCFEGELTKEETEDKLKATLAALELSVTSEKSSGSVDNEVGLDLEVEKSI